MRCLDTKGSSLRYCGGIKLDAEDQDNIRALDIIIQKNAPSSSLAVRSALIVEALDKLRDLTSESTTEAWHTLCHALENGAPENECVMEAVEKFCEVEALAKKV